MIEEMVLLSVDTAKRLRHFAQDKGKTIEEYVRSLLEKEVLSHPEIEIEKDAWLDEFDEWMEGLDPQTPVLSDEQISRESIYEEQVQRQR